MTSKVQTLRDLLHQARINEQKLSGADKDAYNDYLTSQAHKAYEAAQCVTRDLDQQLRDAAINAYDGSNKKIAPGVTIAERTLMEYDENTAFAWAVEHKLALKLDAPKFNKLAGDLDFVTVTKKTSVRVAVDLEQFVADASS